MGKRKEFIGEVVSDKMHKTIVVRIKRMSKDPKYGRIIRRFNKFKAHDENRSAKIGDIVKIQETRPISKEKRFRLLTVIKKSEAPKFEIKEELT